MSLITLASQLDITIWLATRMPFAVLLIHKSTLAAEAESDKLLLTARKMRRATSTDFLISLVADDFSRASNTYVGKLR